MCGLSTCVIVYANLVMHGDSNKAFSGQLGVLGISMKKRPWSLMSPSLPVLNASQQLGARWMARWGKGIRLGKLHETSTSADPRCRTLG